MIIIHRLTPYLIGAAILGSFLLVNAWPAWLWVMLVLDVAIIFFGLARLAGWEFGSEVFWNLLAIPVIFALSGYLTLIFLESQIISVIVAIVIAGFIYLFFEHLFAYFHMQSRYQAYSLEFTSILMAVLALFFMGIGFYGFLLFLHLPLWLEVIVFMPLTYFLVRQSLWASKVEKKRAIVFALACSAVLTEVFMAVSFLPTSLFVNSAILAIVFYIQIGLTRAYFLDKLDSSLVKRYLIIGLLLLVMVLGTAEWV